MRIVIAPDKFKGSLSAPDAAEAMRRGVLAVVADVQVDVVPMADGGEGTVEAMITATGGERLDARVTGPLGEPRTASFARLGDGRTCVLEMAAASGLMLVPADRRDPLVTTTRGTGELVLAAARAGARSILLGIGGSATNDGGAGFAQALGYRLLDAQGRELGPGGGPLEFLDRIDPAPCCRELDDVAVEVACDVANPLCGPIGASAVFGPQKGATPEVVARLDRNLDHFARVVERDLGVAIRDVPGAGAAGGLGGGLLAFARGRLRPGIELVIQAVKLEGRLLGATLCLTAEGSLDASSVHGKTVVGVARLAHRLGIPTIALAGTIGPGAEGVLDQGVTSYLSLCRGPMTLESAMREAPTLLQNATEQALRTFLAGRDSHGKH